MPLVPRRIVQLVYDQVAWQPRERLLMSNCGRILATLAAPGGGILRAAGGHNDLSRSLDGAY